MMTPESIPYLLLAFVLGLAVGYALLLRRRRSLASECDELRKEVQTKSETIAVLDAEKVQFKRIENEHGERGRRIETLTRELGAREIIAGEVPNLKIIIQKNGETNENLRAENEGLKAELKAERDNFNKLQQAREELFNQFEAISKRVINTSNDSFLTLAHQKLGQYQESAKGDLEKRQQAIAELVTPLQTKLREFEQKVDEVYRTEAAERNSLRGEIKNLVELNQQISKEASSLALALKGDTKKQGNWGELILEKVLEFSGLRKGIEYKLQVSVRDDDGKRQQPDAIIFLPEHKHIIVDAKISLVAYDRYISSTTDEARNLALLDHITSVKRHIKELSEKDYTAIPEFDAPDFTLLFMPIESSFGLAVQADNELFEYAWSRKIVIVSPSTLLATLRTIASIWKQERQTKNALEIADRAGKMYDKFAGFVEDMISVGKKMDDAKNAYGNAMNKLSTGSGNLVRQSEQLKEMGAKATKQLSALLLDRALELKSVEPIAAGLDRNLLES